MPSDISHQLVQQDSFFSPFSPWEQVSDLGCTPSSSPPAAGELCEWWGDSQISYQIPEEGLGVIGLLSQGHWKQPLEFAKEPMPAPSPVRSQGAQLVLETAVRGLCRPTLNWEATSPPAGKRGRRPSSQPEVS